MKVESSRSVGPSTVKSGSRTGGTGFAGSLHVDNIENSMPVTGTQYISGIEGLLALQEVGNAQDDRRALSRADEILDRLDELRRGLLLGRIAPSKLSALSQMSQQISASANDPRLREILQEIDLRAQVELAKLEA